MQRRYGFVARPLAVQMRYSEHGGGRLATVVSYWSFVSVFPLLLAAVTVLDIVLKDDEQARDRLLNGALGQIPVIGTELANQERVINGSVTVVVLGVLAALWSGLKAANSLQVALDEIYDVPRHNRSNFFVKRVKALGFLGIMAVGLTLSTTALHAVELVSSAGAVRWIGYVLSIVVNSAIVLAAYWLLPRGRRPFSQLWRGALAAGGGIVLLQLAGGWVIQRWISGASDAYGTFAVVFALLSWFFLISRLLLYCAEYNTVRAERLWPRSLFDHSELTDADRRAAAFDAQRVVATKRLDPAALRALEEERKAEPGPATE